MIYNRLKTKFQLVVQSTAVKNLKFIKESIEGGNKKKKIFVNFCLIIFFIYFIFSSLLFLVRLCISLKNIFYEMFPHYGMSENDFYEKYGYVLQDLTFLEKKNYFLIDFLTWNPETVVFKIFFLFFIISSIYLFFSLVLKKIKEMKNEQLVFIKNTDINITLRFYSFIANKIAEKIAMGEDAFSLEYYQGMKALIIENNIELYYIIKIYPAEDLLFIVEQYKKALITDLEKTPNKQKQFVFDIIEEDFLSNLIKFLEKKKMNKDKMFLVLKDFLEKFSTIKTKQNK